MPKPAVGAAPPTAARDQGKTSLNRGFLVYARGRVVRWIEAAADDCRIGPTPRMNGIETQIRMLMISIL